MTRNTRIREEDIRPSVLMERKKAEVDWDRNFLLKNLDRWEHVDCPACESSKAETFGEKMGFAYVKCQECRTVFTNPRPSQELSHEFYKQSRNYAFWNKFIFPATEKVRRESIFKPRAMRVIDHCNFHGVRFGGILDVGAAYGTFCDEIKNFDIFKHVFALEPTPDLAETCRDRGLETIECPIEDLPNSEFVDVVTSFEVIEHLFAPRKFVLRCHDIIRDDGLLILTCPNVQGFDVATLGLLSSTFDHEHVNYFSPASLSGLLESCGFHVIAVETPGRLDADIVHSRVVDGSIDLSDQPFLHEVLVNRWDALGDSFQKFLSENCLSSHLWIVARKVAKGLYD